MRVLALIPARDEAESLPGVLGELARERPDLEVLVVDDASSDGTARLLAERGVGHLRLGQHLGVGGAVRAGLRYARRHGYDAVVRLDGDGQHQVSEIDRLMGPIREGRADAVQGSRRAAPGALGIAGSRRVLRQSLAAACSRLLGRRVTDPTSGFWGFGSRAIDLLAEHHPTGYPEPELLLLLHRNGLRVDEIPVSMRPRLAGHTSLTTLRGLGALARILLALVVVPLRGAVARPDGD